MGLVKNARRAIVPALFVYGSLMSKKYWRDIVGSKGAANLKIRPAKLKGWRRWWNGHRPSYGGSVLNLKRAADASMWGGLVTGLTKEAWEKLDKQVASHLPRARVHVETKDGERVLAYTYRQKRRGPEGVPKSAYVAAVVAGAKALGWLARHDVGAEVKRLQENVTSTGSRFVRAGRAAKQAVIENRARRAAGKSRRAAGESPRTAGKSRRTTSEKRPSASAHRRTKTKATRPPTSRGTSSSRATSGRRGSTTRRPSARRG